MKAVFKLLVGLMSVMLLLAITAAVLFSTMVNSDLVKNQISQYVKASTGRDLIIKGSLHASFWPRLGINVNDVTLSNPSGFQGDNLLVAHKLTISAELGPLLHRQLAINRASLSDAIINLQKNAQGNTNWDFSSAKQKKSNSSEETNSQESMQFNIASLSLSHTTINYSDTKTQQHYTLENVNISADNLASNQPFPLHGNFIINNSSKTKTNINLKTTANYDSANGTLNLENSDIHIKPENSSEIAINSNIKANLNSSSIKFLTLNLQMGDLKVQGDLTGNYNENNYSFAGNIAYDVYRFSHVKTNPKYSQNRLDLSNFSAGIFGGSTNGLMSINFAGSSPAFTIRQKMSGISADQMLRTLTGSSKLNGVASLNIDINASGKSSSAIKQSLTGAITFNISHGAVYGTDIDYKINQAIAKISQENSQTSDRGYTPFTSLSGTASFSQGVCSNPNLEMLTPTLRIQASGNYNLLSNNINYQLTCRLLQPHPINTEISGTKINADLSNYDIPTKVGCTLQSPCVSVDLGGLLKILAIEGTKAVAKTAIKQQLLKHVDENLGNAINKLLEP